MVLPTPDVSPSGSPVPSTLLSVAEPGPEYEDPGHLERPEGIFNDKASPPFSRIVGLFEVLRDSKPQARKDKLDHWFTIWRTHVGNDLYPAMRLILPHKDRERATYGLKEAGIAKAFIGALGLDRHSRDATRLIKWKQPTSDNKTAGDFPSVVFDVVNARSTVTEGTMSVDDINDVLDEISRAGKEYLSISVKESTVLAVFHPDAMEMFNTSSDLKRVCWLLPNQNQRASDAEKQVQLFQAFQPMLCKRGRTLKESVKMMARQEFIMEEKLDGERMQLHKRGNQFFYCSRKGKDYTYLYGATVGEGALTPWIQDAFDERITDVILDGEMVVWDPSLEKYCDFGALKTAALEAIRSGKDDAPRPCFKIFDILYMKSNSGKETLLTEIPLKNRKKTLHALFRELPGRFEFAISRIGKTVQDVENLLQEVVESRGEGLVLKTFMSKYILGARENCWMKVKPEYMDNMGETVDVLVVSGNYGRGSRGGRVSTLICAVQDDAPKKTKDEQTRYVTLVRIGTGLTFADYDWVNSKNWKPIDRKKPPAWLRLSTAPELVATSLGKRKAEDSLRVYQHGGDFTQALTARATDVFLVYGGNAITLPLKKIMSNDDYDIFKPSWLSACIEAGHLVQPTAKYYFHATARSKVREDFEDSEGDSGDEEFQIVDDEGNQDSEFENDDDDASLLAKKFKSGPAVEGLSRKVSKMVVTRPGAETLKSDVMGEEEEAMEYDTDRLFKHLCFYLDTPDNAEKHSLALKANLKAQDTIKASFTRTQKAILDNGGRVTDSLEDPKLTHIVLNEGDKSRRVELMRRTSKPKRKHLVLEAFIDDCIEEQSLLNEDAYAP
ncbi:DNA ligase (ATP) [Tulasnella sp. 331]|nr:DNA ligase (ATP) [Tulasnella sp. 331]